MAQNTETDTDNPRRRGRPRKIEERDPRLLEAIDASTEAGFTVLEDVCERLGGQYRTSYVRRMIRAFAPRTRLIVRLLSPRSERDARNRLADHAIFDALRVAQICIDYTPSSRSKAFLVGLVSSLRHMTRYEAEPVVTLESGSGWARGYERARSDLLERHPLEREALMEGRRRGVDRAEPRRERGDRRRGQPRIGRALSGVISDKPEPVAKD